MTFWSLADCVDAFGSTSADLRNVLKLTGAAEFSQSDICAGYRDYNTRTAAAITFVRVRIWGTKVVIDAETHVYVSLRILKGETASRNSWRSGMKDVDGRPLSRNCDCLRVVSKKGASTEHLEFEGCVGPGIDVAANQ